MANSSAKRNDRDNTNRDGNNHNNDDDDDDDNDSGESSRVIAWCSEDGTQHEDRVPRSLQSIEFCTALKNLEVYLSQKPPSSPWRQAFQRCESTEGVVQFHIQNVPLFEHFLSEFHRPKDENDNGRSDWQSQMTQHEFVKDTSANSCCRLQQEEEERWIYKGTSSVVLSPPTKEEKQEDEDDDGVDDDDNEKSLEYAVLSPCIPGISEEKMDLTQSVYQFLVTPSDESPRSTTIMVVSGPEGVGKSHLASEIVRRNDIRRRYEGIAWIRQSHRDGNLKGIYRDCVNQLRLSCADLNDSVFTSKDVEKEHQNTEIQLYQKMCALLKGKRVLLVLDDLTSWERLPVFLFQGVALLITTRQTDDPPLCSSSIATTTAATTTAAPTTTPTTTAAPTTAPTTPAATTTAATTKAATTTAATTTAATATAATTTAATTTAATRTAQVVMDRPSLQEAMAYFKAFTGISYLHHEDQEQIMENIVAEHCKCVPGGLKACGQLASCRKHPGMPLSELKRRLEGATQADENPKLKTMLDDCRRMAAGSNGNHMVVKVYSLTNHRDGSFQQDTRTATTTRTSQAATNTASPSSFDRVQATAESRLIIQNLSRGGSIANYDAQMREAKKTSSASSSSSSSSTS